MHQKKYVGGTRKLQEREDRSKEVCEIMGKGQYREEDGAELGDPVGRAQRGWGRMLGAATGCLGPLAFRRGIN